MKVLQRKMLILVISSILISALLVMAIAFFNYGRVVESDSKQIMQLICSEKRQEIDEKLLNIEQSVNTIYHYAIGQIRETDNLWQDEERYLEHIANMSDLMETTAEYTDGAVSVYYRITTEVWESTRGIWLVQGQSGEFYDHEITDLSLYESDDIEHVGWYYIPIENGKETWMNPYFNQNMDDEIISYVIPIFEEDDVVGVIGMDISTNLLYDSTRSVTVYDSGYAFLMDNEGKFVYHPEMKGNLITDEFDSQHAYLYEKSLLSTQKQSVESYYWNGLDKRLTSQKLRNGMIFTVCVTEKEIKQPQQKMLLQSTLVIGLVMAVFVWVTVSITKVILRLMYTDSMTRVGNKLAYAECVDALSKRMADKEKCGFTVLVADINDLKKTNDTYGHEYGDMLIQRGAAVLKKVWESEFIYRIGGDEFAIVLLEAEKACVEKSIILLEKELVEYNKQNSKKELRLQMAVGMAVYNPKTDKEYMDVFRKADIAMYENKKYKKTHEV